MSINFHGRHAAMNNPEMAQAHANAQRCNENEVVTYLDAMLTFAPGTAGNGYRAGKGVRWYAGLRDFVSEAIPLHHVELQTAIDRGLNRGDRLWRHIDQVDHYFRLYSDDFVHDPMLSVFFHVFSRPKFWRGIWSIFNWQAAAFGRNYRHVNVEAYAELVGDMRAAALRANISRKMMEWTFPVNANVARVKNYEACLFERYPVVAAIELVVWYPRSAVTGVDDAHFRQEVLESQQAQARERVLATPDTKESVGEEAANGLRVMPIDVLARDLRHIFDNLGNKKSLSRAKVGHACSIEWSRMIGHYARVMLFFDGLAVPDPVAQTDLLGDYCIEVTKGRMTYINCNALSNQYSQGGLIHVDDKEQRHVLRRRMLLWAQKEQFLRLKASRGFKTFRTSDMPAARHATR